MEIIRGIHNLRSRHHGCVATIGNFDGVHHGHRALLAHLEAKARELGLPATLITFEPQPREYFAGATVPGRLTRFREKMVLLDRIGLDRVVCLPFNRRLASLPAREIVERYFVDALGVQFLVVGDDFRFGQGREGDYAMLQAAGREFGFGVSHLGTLTLGEERVSSTRVREQLGAGRFDTAEQLLGHPYFIMGRVVYGRRLGREIGTPTANIRLQRYRAALEGVFAVEVDGIDASTYSGVANVGVRPTIDGREPLLEVHLLETSAELYGRLLTVTFRAKLRDEYRFDSLEELKTQIGRDVDEARAFFLKHRIRGDGRVFAYGKPIAGTVLP